jgi:single-strand DNA-binding protein
MSVNKVIILGRLGSDPELKYTPGGTAVCGFSLATTESYDDKKTGQKKESTEWHKVVVWGKLAELCNQYLSKGKQAYVEGSLKTRSWDAKDGTKRYATEIIAKTVQFIDAKGSSSTAPETESEPEHDFSADDIPF